MTLPKRGVFGFRAFCFVWEVFENAGDGREVCYNFLDARKANMERKAEIPEFLAHLKTYGGYPVPFTHMEHCARCLRDKLCAICGRRLGEYCYFIGGPLSKKNRLFVDPAMHKQCAEFASQTCPFLTGQKLEYSSRAAEHKDALVTKVPMAPRPDTMFIMRTYTKKVRAVTVNGKAMIQAGSWIGVREFGGS